MVTDGTSLVEVSAISFDAAPSQHAEAVAAKSMPRGRAESMFVQVGAFGEPENARRRFAMLRDNGIEKAFVHKDGSASPAIYRVRIGPIASVMQYDSIVEQLQGVGISESHLVSE